MVFGIILGIVVLMLILIATYDEFYKPEVKCTEYHE